MSDRTPPSGPFVGFLRRCLARSRPGHWAALGVVGLGLLGLAGLRSVELPGPRGVDDGDRLRIEVVAPVEPRLTPGSVMDVGELMDGFRYVAPDRAARAPVYEAAWLEEEGAAPDAPPSRPAEMRRYASDAYAPPPEPERPRRERERRWFGFDNPLPDFGAERRARQARLDALDDQRRAEFEDHRDGRRHHNPPRDQRPEEPADGPYGPEVG